MRKGYNYIYKKEHKGNVKWKLKENTEKTMPFSLVLHDKLRNLKNDE